ncbi:MAG: MarR family transcriptional regulator [Acidobacteriales bacterium]|nr:MarR family transcriptional regulator [Terriglobales bacterium]
MEGKLAKEIWQTKPFSSREEEAYLNLGRTFEFLQARVAGLLKQYELTPVQYNMLRILRGADSEGITCKQACERMLSPDPDITRLLDRMEARKWLRRERSPEDRRVVMTWITPEGLDLVNRIDQPLADLLRNMMGFIGQIRLRELIETLEALRANPA